ncbi:MAG TPA: CRISPR system precrRNA processing endoribonuclease RAMP protein Cas6 [Thermoanaerobaculia bacterium]|nr:CRISPR system precrRNA processing endoribonuclease RAMP protein Cas6 [Thermoanaerobaculia bacterium]
MIARTPRSSRRRSRKPGRGALTRTLDLEGDLAPLAPLLRAAEVTHLGKGAVLGLGQIAIANG